MAIYGNTISFGGGGSNDTLPPLLDNFKATRLEGGIVPPTANTLAFKDIPDGSKIKLVKGSKISGTVTYGTTTDLNHRIVFDSNDWTKKEFELENDSTQHNISGSDIDQWLNSTKASDWWMPVGERDENRTSPDYRYEQGFLYQLGITDELLAQNFNDININATAKAKVGLPWGNTFGEVLSAYTFFNNMNSADVGEYGGVYLSSGEYVLYYNKPQTKAPSPSSLYNTTVKIHPMMEPKPETKVALDVDGSYFMFENQAESIVLSADKMEESRATDLAGAVWVYGDHIPQNKNDGTKIELARDEVIKPDFIPPITLADVPVSDADTETVVNLKESDGQLHPYIYMYNNYENSSAGLLLRKEIIGNAMMSNANYDGCPIDTSIIAFKNGLPTNIQDNLVDVNLRIVSSRTILRSAFALSMSELTANGSSGDGTPLPYFNVNYENPSEKRIAYKDYRPVRYWTRTSSGTNGYYIDTDGRVLFGTVTVSLGVRPAICLKTSFKLNATPNKDGSYDMYEESSAQTLATGKTIADLPSKSKVKLGRYGDADLQWLVSRNAENKLFLILAAESMSVLETKMFDNAEPSNPNGDRASNGNNKYSLSNIHQWLNSDKSANSWYTKSHTYDASPDYTNLDGFLAKWTNAELQAVLNTTWTTTTAEVDGDNTETFQSKITLPSTTEMNLESNTGGSKLDIFDSNEDRTIAGKYYWCRTPFPSKPSGERMVDIKGKLSAILVNQTTVGVRPICSIPETTLVSDTPDSDGCYTLIAPPLERTVAWDKSKNFYARQFTYNSKKQYQTMLEGATAYLPIMPDGQELSKLPSKSKVKLGRYGDADLQWLVSRNAENKLILVLDSNSISALGNKILDAAEPNNSNSDRRNYGNNRYIYTNLHQWLNAEKGANQWFVKAHNADTPPDYQNQAGFLNGWKKEELDLLELAEWTVTKSGTDGSGKETFRSRVVLPSTTEMGFSSEGGGSKLDIFNSDSGRQTGSTYWTRTPFPTSPCINYQVKSDGTQYSGGYNSYDGAIRPICSIPETTLVSIETDSEGCFTLV